MRKGPGSAYDKWNIYVVIINKAYMFIYVLDTHIWWVLESEIATSNEYINWRLLGMYVFSTITGSYLHY
jgi:hypothetical protein